MLKHKLLYTVLLLGFYNPEEGEILINGTAVQGMSLEQLRSHFAYVPQESKAVYRQYP
ncbi:hypothetical protein D3C76_40720 [compost metagenome]